MSAKIEAILQGGGKISSRIASWQILESVSIICSQRESPSHSFSLYLEREGGFRFLRASKNQIPSLVSSHQG